MITHILKDGTVLDDITGHVVKKEDAPMAYEIMNQMNNDQVKKGENNGNQV